jgi:ABC-type sugar transport system ATPase subunit
VSFEIAAGTCHALCGENGAGKSTLGKILAGIYQPDSGEIRLDGRPVRFAGPTQALAAGVSLVHQELAFCDNLTVAENLCLGSLPARGPFLSRAAMHRRAQEMLASIGAEVDVRRLMGDLPIAQQQMAQIAAAIDTGARLIVFDEPTSSLSQREADRLYELIAMLRTRGITSIYISHRLDEIFRLCDTVTVLRDGRHVATRPASTVDTNSLVEMMIGRPLAEYLPSHITAAPGAERLRVEHLSSPAGVHDVSFSVRAGEVIGIAGLVGAGRSEMARAIFGLDGRATGRVVVDGRVCSGASPSSRIAAGLGLVPEDRKRQGLVLSMNSIDNTTLAILRRIGRGGFLRRRDQEQIARPFARRLGVPEGRLDRQVATFSGGNQQKVALSKWLAARCPVLILDEPTRGVDVGAKAEIHALIDELAQSGTAIVLISSEMPEVLYLSSRILVFRGGRIVGELTRAEARQDVLMRMMANVA